jgi:HAD superfamily hydrolase (TIGR01490 family)
MSGFEKLLAEVEAAPRGRRTGAFFDFDGTLIDGYSAMAMMQHRARRREMSPLEAARLLMVGIEASRGKADFERFMTVGVEAFRGREATDLDEMGERLMLSVLGGTLYAEAWQLVEAHRRRGHTVVIATSALPFQVEPLARELGIEHVLCTRLEAKDGLLTGKIDGPILWGPGKAAAVRAFAQANRLDLGRSWAYGNGDEDEEFLSTVGKPRPLNPAKGLARVAGERDWPITRFRRRGRVGVTEVARTLAAYGGMATAFGAGLGIGLVNWNRQDAVNFTMATGSDAALALAGIRLNVTGEEHLWSQRPAIFIFNHQSILDGFIVMKLLRQDVTGVAKKEVASQPGFGQFAKFAGMAFVDRGNTGKAVDVLAPVVEKLREGYSIAISPEGTRSPTPRIAPFKKGAFHMAMQGQVPIVPIVIRNAGELFWRGSTFMRSGTADIAVLPPISVADWKRDELNERVEEVRAQFVATLADWPGSQRALHPVADAPATGNGRAREKTAR